MCVCVVFFFFQAEDGIRDLIVTGVQTCALPISLTREKIVAAASKTFVCIMDDTKFVDRLGEFPLPIEVVPFARSYVSRRMVILGGRPEYRHGFITDNGNEIIDVSSLKINEPVKLESEINQIAGVLTNGLFAARSADVLLVGSDDGVRVIN